MMFQLAFTAMSAFRAVGAFLFLTFLVAPVLTARIFTKKLFPLIALSCGIGVLGSFIAVALTRHLLSTYQIALSTSGVVSVILGLFFFIGLVHKRRAFK